MIKYYKVLILLTFFYGFFGCNKDENCITILEKKTLNSKYYFLFEPEENIFSNTNNLQSTNIPDQYSSGEVDYETFEMFKVGDEYCNF